MPVIKFEGIEELEKKFAKNIQLDTVKKIVKQNGSELHEKAQKNADFKGHWGWKPGVGRAFIKPTGNLKQKIMLDIKDGGLTAEVEPTAEYSAYVELGTRKMEAQPYLKPAYEVQKEQFKKDMQNLVK